MDNTLSPLSQKLDRLARTICMGMLIAFSKFIHFKPIAAIISDYYTSSLRRKGYSDSQIRFILMIMKAKTRGLIRKEIRLCQNR